MRSKNIIYNISTNLLLQIVVVIYGFIVPKIIISLFGSSVNGLITSITQFLAYITLLESGFGPIVKATLYKPIANKDKKKIFSILKTTEKFFRKISIIFVIYIIFLMFFYPLIISNEFNYLYTISLIIIISMSTFAEYFFGMTYKLYLQAEQKTYIISLIQILTYILSIIIIIILANLNFSIHIIKLASGLIFVIRPLLQNLYVKKKYNINFKNVDDSYKIKNKWDGLAQHIASVIHSNTDITILTVFSSLIEVSVYSIYLLIVTGIKLIIQSFSNGIDASFGDMIAKNEYANLNKKFHFYEVMYFIITTIIFSSTIILIVPFVSVYTKDINDANYVRYLFGTLIVISEFIWAIRLPYSSITLAAGHFKETRLGAWIEAISNIIISIILVIKYGIIGVTIGTIVAMTIRTIEFVYHTNKYILKRNIMKSVSKIILVVIETLIIVLISKKIPMLENVSYVNWILNAILVSSVSSTIVLIVNFIFYRSEIKELLSIIKKFFKKKEGLKYE